MSHPAIEANQALAQKLQDYKARNLILQTQLTIARDINEQNKVAKQALDNQPNLLFHINQLETSFQSLIEWADLKREQSTTYSEACAFSQIHKHLKDSL